MFTTRDLLIFIGACCAIAAIMFVSNWVRAGGLSRWWKSGLFVPPAVIPARINGRLVMVQPQFTRGAHLVCLVADGQQTATRMVGAESVVDRELFWKTWKYYGGQIEGWVDEDGNDVKLG